MTSTFTRENLLDGPNYVEPGVMEATDYLADDPRPVGSFPYGNEDLRRLRVGRYRVLFEVDPHEKTVTIIHIGRIA